MSENAVLERRTLIERGSLVKRMKIKISLDPPGN